MATGGKRRSNSKKYVIKQLNTGWQCKLFEIQKRTTESQNEKNQGDSLMALSICIATGLRPEELETGVILRTRPDGSAEVEIQGAKVSRDENERGIETRWIVVNPEFSMASKYLTDEIPKILFRQGVSAIHFSYNKSTLRKLVGNLGKRYLKEYQSKQLDLQISPYCFRHSMAAALKSCENLDDTERAQVLGHLSINSMESYAKGFRTKTPIKPALSVRSTEIPRLKEKKASNNFKATRMKLKLSKASVSKKSRCSRPSI